MNYIPVRCGYCNSEILKDTREYNRGQKEGYKHFYCGNKCRGLHQSNTTKAPCAECGKFVVRTASESLDSKSGLRFCNRACSAKYNNKIRSVPVKEIFKCVCGVEIPVRFNKPEACAKCLLKRSVRLRDLKCAKCLGAFQAICKPRKRKYCDPCLRQIRSEHGQVQGKKQNTNRRSKNEILFAELCKSKFENVLENPKMFNGWDADVVIEELKIAVLWNGKWHYQKIKSNHSLGMVQNRDSIKMKEIEKAGYKCYIIKDLGGHNPDFVQQQFNDFVNSFQFENFAF